MTAEIDQHTQRRERFVLLALAACCIGPMLAIIVLTAVVGIAIGTAAAITIGAVAAAVCVVVMISRHRTHDHADHHQSSVS
ncbi:MAG: hypothetical protein ABIP03_14465 [Aquihabitans sp.]